MDGTALPNLPLYGTIVGSLVVLALGIMGAIAFWNGKESADAFSTLIERANIVQMLTVVMIIMAAVGLRLLDKITPEAVVSMLSGIAGYVLGGSGRNRKNADDAERAKSAPAAPNAESRRNV